MMNEKRLQSVTTALNDFLQGYDPELATDPETPTEVYKTLLSEEGKLQTIEMLLEIIEDMKHEMEC